MKKIFVLVFSFVFLHLSAYSNEITKCIKNSDFEMYSTVSMYIINKDTNKIIYKKNEHKLLNPASILKTLTFGAAYKTLGADYRFETDLYKDKNNDIYIKLSADPMLSSQNLKDLLLPLKKMHFSLIYIDDTIIDKTPYPQSWMEEDVWPNQRAITPYIVDNNYTKILIKRSSLASNVDIIQNDPYKIPVINELVPGDTQDYKITKLYGENSPIIGFRGTIANDEILTLPTLNPEINFKIKLQKALKDIGIENSIQIQPKKIPQNSQKIATISHSIDEVSKNILFNSDNFSSEVVSKVAGAKYINYREPATFEDGIEMFYSVFAPKEGIKIADSSGVSRYNLLNTKYLVDCLCILFKDENYKNLLMTANQGTLKDRLSFLEGNLRAKTGTLSGMSSITGSLKTKNKNNLIFAIIVQNSPKRKAVLKNFENSIITVLYRKY